MTADTTERGFEDLICKALTGYSCNPSEMRSEHERPATYAAGWLCGDAADYNREFCLDLVQLSAFLNDTQPKTAASLDLDDDTPNRRQFLARLSNEISRRGTIEVLRNGVKHESHALQLFYGTPSAGNEEAIRRYQQNRFSVTRQLRYSNQETQRALDLCLFINGLPVATFELKNSLTKQTVEDAIEQYKRDRNPHEPLFKLGRCLVHFAVDDHEVHFCTELKGKSSRFLPFNQGWNDGAGNPPNPHGLKTDYLWQRVLTRDSLTNIIENYAQLVSLQEQETRRVSKKQIWPRYHQLDGVRRLLADVEQHGVGQRYLIQHSAGSGKSNSIAWLAHQLVALAKDAKPIFDSIIVVTDRLLLDRQIKDTLQQYAQVGAILGHADSASNLRELIESGKKIIISTIQKFPFIVQQIGDEHRSRNFAIIIDEAHSSQGGRMSATMGEALSEQADEAGEVGETSEGETYEDQINRLIELKKMSKNASYFAFTATPKNKTLEIFGQPDPQTDGAVKHRAFHSYTMKQAIEEGFIMDVLAHYTPVSSYYKLIKTVEHDPQFDAKRAQKKLRKYVEGHDHAIRLKAEIMVDHFLSQVVQPQLIGGQARAMVVTDGIRRAISYYQAISNYLMECKSPHRAVVAFSGEHEYGGEKVTEASLNGFSSNLIAEKLRQNPYRILVCADKFQTGYDEPLLHTMYVDKELSNIKAVQTLSRLNRAHPQKKEVFVLDFRNDVDVIRDAFADYYRATILSDETDPNRLHDLQSDLDGAQVYSAEQVKDFVSLFLGEAERGELDSILDKCVAVYLSDLGEDAQAKFKSNARKFVRTYHFLSCILLYKHIEWEERSIFFNFLIPKLPLLQEEDLSKGILNAIDMDSYRVEKQIAQKIILPDEDTEIDPMSEAGGGGKPEPEMDWLSNIIREFNERFGAIQCQSRDKLEKTIAVLPEKVSRNPAYQNARVNSDQQNARIEHDQALQSAIADLFDECSDLSKLFSDSPLFKQWLSEKIFDATYHR